MYVESECEEEGANLWARAGPRNRHRRWQRRLSLECRQESLLNIHQWFL